MLKEIWGFLLIKPDEINSLDYFFWL